MIDNFSILLSHALLALALWRLANRPDLDREPPPVPDTPPSGFARKPAMPERSDSPDA